MKINDKVAFAREFASLLHDDQGQKYGDGDYFFHLQAVADVLLRFDILDKVSLAAAYLHDTVEDTGISLQTIHDLFGEEVATLVGAVTDEPGENRKARKALTYPKIKATPGATALKLADRIANVEYGIATKNVRMHKMYIKEYPELERSLRVFGELDAMWLHLAGLHLTAI